MDRKNQFFVNFSSNLMQYGFSLITNFAIVSMMIRRLGIPANGLWVLLASIAEYFSLLDIGLSTAFLKHMSESRGRGDKASSAELFHYSLFFYRLAAVASLTLGMLTIWLLPHFFHIPAGQLTAARWTLAWLTADASLSLFLSPGRIVLQSFHRFDQIQIGFSLKWLLRFGLFALLLAGGQGIATLAAANFIVNAALWIVLAIQGWRLFSATTWSTGHLPSISAGLKKSLFHYSSWIVLSLIASRFFYYVDTLLVGIFRSSMEVMFYFAAWKLVEVVRGIVQALLPFFVPLASEMEAGQEKEKIPILFFQGMRLTILFSYPLIAYLIVLGDHILRVWVGPQFVSYYPLIPILLLPQIIIFTYTPSSVIAYGINRHKPFIIYSLISSIINLLLSLWLIKPLGLWGVAWGTSITLTICAVFDFYFHPWLIGFSRRTYKKIFFRAMALLAGAMLVLAALRQFVSTPWTSLLLGLFIIPLFGWGYYLIEFKPMEKESIRQLARRFVTALIHKFFFRDTHKQDQTR
jgi:O-antigen/teichoic acid export membrane protein